MLFQDHLVLIRGAGDLATGVALRLHRAGFPLVMLELPEPLVVRRTVAFAEAVREGIVIVEGIAACHADDPREARLTAHRGDIAVMVDPTAAHLPRLRPNILVDARLAKRNLDTTREQARLVIGLGPGFTAGQDVHAVVETMRGHHLGRVLWEGSVLPNTGTPGLIGDKGAERVLRAPIAGRVVGQKRIGEVVQAGELVALIQPEQGEAVALVAPFTGLLRGLIANGTTVPAKLKIGDLDPRLDTDIHTVSDKALAIGGGVVEAVLSWLSTLKRGEP